MNSRTRSRSSSRSSDVGSLKLGVCFVEANLKHNSGLETIMGSVLRVSSERDSAEMDDIMVDIAKAEGYSRYSQLRVKFGNEARPAATIGNRDVLLSMRLLIS